MKRVKGFNLIHTEKIKPQFEYPDGTRVIVNTVFQIWSKKFKNETKKESTCNKYIKIYSLSDGGTPSSIRNKKMIDKCNIYIPSTCFGKEKMKLYNSFEKLPSQKGYGILFLKDEEKLLKTFKEIEWSKESFKSTNSAYNLRSSIIIKAITDKGIVD